MYDPVTARFLQEDTYRGTPGDPLSLNLYTYVVNNPLVYWDPSGYDPVKVTVGTHTGIIDVDYDENNTTPYASLRAVIDFFAELPQISGTRVYWDSESSSAIATLTRVVNPLATKFGEKYNDMRAEFSVSPEYTSYNKGKGLVYKYNYYYQDCGWYWIGKYENVLENEGSGNYNAYIPYYIKDKTTYVSIKYMYSYMIGRNSGEISFEKVNQVTTSTPTLTVTSGTGNTWLNNLKNDTTLGLSKSKKEAMLAAANELINQGYELAFIAGVLGNIKNEGNIGQFEYSAYTSKPRSKPDYLIYMDNNYNYSTDYSGQSIVGKSLSKVYNMLLNLEPNNWRDPNTNSRRGFGLGSVQWTFSRTKTLVETYMEVANGSDTITLKQAAQAEGMMIVRELASADYNQIYPDWLKANQSNLNSSQAAYNAGHDVCIEYERPTFKQTKAKVRGVDAQKIFNVMK